MCFPGGNGGGSDELLAEYERQRAEEEARQNRIAQGKQEIENAFLGYDDDFYSGISTDYMDYATPQIEDQYEDALKQLRVSLARSGNLDSSLRTDRIARLNERNADAYVDAQRQGENYANQVRGNLNTVKSNLLQQNQSLADPSLIASMAANQSYTASQMPAYNPIAQLFDSVTSGLATQAQLEARDKARYEMAELFNLGDRSRVVSQ